MSLTNQTKRIGEEYAQCCGKPMLIVKKQRPRVLLSVLIVALVITGCGGGSDSNTEADVQHESEPSNEPESETSEVQPDQSTSGPFAQPLGTSPPRSQQVDDPDVCGVVQGKYYHKQSCRNAKNGTGDVFSASRSWAVARGYKPCAECKPGP